MKKLGTLFYAGVVGTMLSFVVPAQPVWCHANLRGASPTCVVPAQPEWCQAAFILEVALAAQRRLGISVGVARMPARQKGRGVKIFLSPARAKRKTAAR